MLEDTMYYLMAVLIGFICEVSVLLNYFPMNVGILIMVELSIVIGVKKSMEGESKITSRIWWLLCMP